MQQGAPPKRFSWQMPRPVALKREDTAITLNLRRDVSANNGVVRLYASALLHLVHKTWLHRAAGHMTTHTPRACRWRSGGTTWATRKPQEAAIDAWS